jgi:hypothetical protein
LQLFYCLPQRHPCCSHIFVHFSTGLTTQHINLSDTPHSNLQLS